MPISFFVLGGGGIWGLGGGGEDQFYLYGRGIFLTRDLLRFCSLLFAFLYGFPWLFVAFFVMQRKVLVALLWPFGGLIVLFFVATRAGHISHAPASESLLMIR